MSATREGWLVQAGRHTASLLKQATGLDVPEHHVSVGFPRGAQSRGGALGQCWDGALSRDGQPQLFVSPIIGETAQVLAVVLHEQIHAIVGSRAGHRGDFVKVARAVGFVRPWTRALPGGHLALSLNEIIAELGTFPHPPLEPPFGPRPGSRLRLWQCGCPVKVRVASDDFAAHCDVCLGAFVRQGR